MEPVPGLSAPDALVSELLPYLPLALTAALLLAGIVGLRMLVNRTVDDSTRRYRLRKFVTYGGVLAVLLVVLASLSSEVARLSVAIGAIGAATVFALQEVIASIAGWIALSFGGFYKPGDRVEVGKIKGDVIDIGLLRTTLMEIGAWVGGDQYSGRMVRVANSFVFKEPVFNYSAEFPFLWDEIRVPIRYGSDLERATQLVLEAAQAEVGSFTAASQESWNKVTRRFLIEQARLDPAVTARATDNWIELTLRYITDYKRRRSTADAITRRVLAGVEASEGKVRLASATFELVGLPRVEVDVGK